MTKIQVRPLPWFAPIVDIPVKQVMYVLSGTRKELPQSTHRYNNQKLTPSDVKYLIKDDKSTVYQNGSPNACEPWKYGLPIFHIPILGGWREYVVLEPVKAIRPWHLGWISEDFAVGVSQIPLEGPVRPLIGQKDVRFFGIYSDGSQIDIQHIGSGKIWEIDRWKDVPLL